MRRSVPGDGDSTCKGPVVGIKVMLFRHRKKDNMLELQNASRLIWVQAFAMCMAMGVLSLSAPPFPHLKMRITFIKVFIDITVASPANTHKY